MFKCYTLDIFSVQLFRDNFRKDNVLFQNVMAITGCVFISYGLLNFVTKEGRLLLFCKSLSFDYPNTCLVQKC